MQTVSDLICSARGIEPELGDIPGTCIFCGRPPSGDRCRYPMRVDEVVAY